jgi:carbon-monoxide dehydrogenase large subunit
VVKVELVNQRVVANYIEPRGVVAEIDERDRVVLTLGSQGSHMILHGVGEAVMKLTRDQIRVITNDTGGGFGTKAVPYGEYALAGRAAQKLKKVVAWVAEMAVDKDGKFFAIRVDTIAAMGAYLSAVAPYIPYLGASMLPGVYTIPVMHARVRAVYTHTVPVEAYRGAGRPEAAYVIERLVDAVARVLKQPPPPDPRRHKAPASTTAATSRGIWRGRKSSPTGMVFPPAPRLRTRPANSPASGSRATSRPAA